MKRIHKLLLLSASLVLASCGGGSSSSSSSASSKADTSQTSSAATTSQEVSSKEAESSLPAESSKEAESSDPEESSIPEESSSEFVPSADKYGVLLGEFDGPNGHLSVEVEKATMTTADGQTIADLTPTGFGFVEIGDEVLKTVEYVDGDGYEYRIHLSVGDYKFVEIDFNDEGTWTSIDLYMPDASAFAGCYNLYERGDTSPSNILRLYGNEYDDALCGYPVRYMYRANYGDLYGTAALHSFFTLEDGEYVLAADEWDLEDREYYGFPFTVTETGLRYVDSAADDWFPDFSLLLDLGVDSEGTIRNYYFDEELYDADTYDTIGAPELHHDDDIGFYYTFGDMTVIFNANTFEIKEDGKDVYYAPIWTFYSNLDYYSRVFADDEHTIEFSLEMNWDTWVYELSVTIDDVAAPNAKFGVAPRGQAYIDLGEGSLGSIYRGDEHYATLVSAEGEKKNLFDLDYISSVYAGTIYGVAYGAEIRITVTDDAKYSFNDSDAQQGYFDVDPLYGVVLNCGDNTLLVNIDLGYYALVYLESTSAFYFVSEEIYQAEQDTYRGKKEDNGTEVLRISTFNNITYRGAVAENATLGFTQNNNGYIVPIINFNQGQNSYVAVFDMMGALAIYSYENYQYAYLESALSEEDYRALSKTFLYYSEEYGLEEFTFDGENGVFRITTATTEGSELVTYDTYMFSHNEDGTLAINIAMTVGEQTIAVPFSFDGEAVYSPTGYAYVEAPYYYAQGVWYYEDMVVVVSGTTITVNGTVENVNHIVSDLGTYIFYMANQDLYQFWLTPTGPNSATLINQGNQFAHYDFNVEDWLGEYTGDAENTWELKIDSVTGALTCYKNGSFFMNKYTIVIQDGNVCLQFKTPFGTATFSIANGEKTVEHVPANL